MLARVPLPAEAQQLFDHIVFLTQSGLVNLDFKPRDMYVRHAQNQWQMRLGDIEFASIGNLTGVLLDATAECRLALTLQLPTVLFACGRLRRHKVAQSFVGHAYSSSAPNVLNVSLPFHGPYLPTEIDTGGGIVHSYNTSLLVVHVRSPTSATPTSRTRPRGPFRRSPLPAPPLTLAPPRIVPSTAACSSTRSRATRSSARRTESWRKPP